MNGSGMVYFLFMVFLILKLSGAVEMSWIWVFSPIWITALMTMVFFGMYFIGSTISKNWR